MSDPVKNAEVEDVLSSIRRLVSEDKRLFKSSPAASVAPETVTPVDRLVLTPALRVPDEKNVPPEQNTVEKPVEPETPLYAEQAQADQSAADATAADDVEMPDAETPDVDAGDDLDVLLAATDVAPGAQDPSPVDAEQTAELADDYADDPYNFVDPQDAEGEGATALLLSNPSVLPNDAQGVDATASKGADQPVAQADSVDHDAQDNQPMMPAPQYPADDAAGATTPKTDGAFMHGEMPTVDSARDDPFPAKIAALETAIGGISYQWEPDDAGQDAYAGSEPEAMAWEDDAGSEPEIERPSLETEHADAASLIDTAPQPEEHPVETAGDHAVPSEEGTQEAGFAISTEDQLLDEETLREMINEIVHSELQGALGERITRNVRRLVRREIHRALTARELD